MIVPLTKEVISYLALGSTFPPAAIVLITLPLATYVCVYPIRGSIRFQKKKTVPTITKTTAAATPAPISHFLRLLQKALKPLSDKFSSGSSSKLSKSKYDVCVTLGRIFFGAYAE